MSFLDNAKKKTEEATKKVARKAEQEVKEAKKKTAEESKEAADKVKRKKVVHFSPLSFSLFLTFQLAKGTAQKSRVAFDTSTPR